jgi:HK97 family phage portal protein
MRLFGYEVAVRKAPRSLSPVDDSRGWYTVATYNGPGFPQWFQRDENVDLNPDRALQNGWVFACQTLIAADIGKLAPVLKTWNESHRIYEIVKSPAVSPFLLKPNGYQTWPKFLQRWMFSKLSDGNAYALKVRDARDVVIRAHILDPRRTTPLVSESGDVFYRLGQDNLAEIQASDIVVPASEIMHDRMWCLFHPLVGLSPIFANCMAAIQGLEIQGNSAKFFRNSSIPSGILVSPQRIDDKLAEDYKKRWETNYGGENRGRTAVLGNGLEYKQLTMSAVDSEIVAQLKSSAEMIASTYHVPAYKIGAGPIPTYQNAQVLNGIYYSDCLQSLIIDVQETLREGLDLDQKGFVIHLNLDDLLLMDASTQMEVITKGVQGRVVAPNEGRRKLNYPPVTGGDAVLAQHQDHSLAAIARRDEQPDPFATAPAPAPQPAAANDDDATEAAEKFADALVAKFLTEMESA